MCRQRQIPRCTWCDTVIAKAVLKKRKLWKPYIFEDVFKEWEYFEHECDKMPKPSKKAQIERKELLDRINNENTIKNK